MANFERKPWVNPFRKMLVFRLFELLVFIAQESVFSVLQYFKRHFPGPYCLIKNLEKTAIFGPKPWVNFFGRMSIFRFFGLVVFIAYKGVFSFQNIIKDVFLAYIVKKKNIWKNGHFSTKTMGQPLWKNVNFSTL